MDWFRWHRGAVHDPRLRTIARRSQQPEGIVLAVLALLSENASQNAPRGTVERWDHEDAAIALGWTAEGVASICEAMQGKYLDGWRLVDWERDQPHREREDRSVERVRAHRERKRQETPVKPKASRVTPRNATKRPEREERLDRVDETEETTTTPQGGAGALDLGRADRLLGWFIGKYPGELSDSERGKQAGIAKRICDGHKPEDVNKAIGGMPLLYPYSEGTPWTLVDLAREFPKALMAAANPPKANGNGRASGRNRTDESWRYRSPGDPPADADPVFHDWGAGEGADTG